VHAKHKRNTVASNFIAISAIGKAPVPKLSQKENFAKGNVKKNPFQPRQGGEEKPPAQPTASLPFSSTVPTRVSNLPKSLHR
jgi:hypothetical protein